jgi:integrase
MQRKYIKRFTRFHFGEIKSIEILKGLKAGEFRASEKYTKAGNLTSDELEKILRSALSLRDKAMLALLYESAARPEELLKLTWAKKDVDLENGEVTLYSSKTGGKRTIPIKESVIHLNRWKQEWQFPDIKDCDYIFPSITRENKLTTAALNNIIKKTIGKAGIKKDKITAYTFRHSRLTDIYNRGVMGFNHNIFAGHIKGSKQTATYVKTDEEEMKAAMLEKVYHIEDITLEKRTKLEKEIDEMKKKFNNDMNMLQNEIERIKHKTTAKYKPDSQK